MSGTLLDPIVAAVRRRADTRRRTLSLEQLRQRVKPDARRRARFVEALTRREMTLICELKRRSPSAGVLISEPAGAQRDGPRWRALAEAYVRGGAAALSVLTEEDHFDGALDDLQSVAFTQLPRLRKDFLLDEGMVLESGLHGADAVLLIAAILDDAQLARLRAVAKEYGFAVLLEVHDERELERALPLEPELLGVNARDLKTLKTDLAVVERLLPRVPKTALKVAESGLRTGDDLKRVRAAGADCALIGEALVRAHDPAAVLAAWKEALRGS